MASSDNHAGDNHADMLTDAYVYAVTITSDTNITREPHTRGCTRDVALGLIHAHVARASATPMLYAHDDVLIAYKLPKNNVYVCDGVCEMLPTRPIGFITIPLRSS